MKTVVITSSFLALSAISIGWLVDGSSLTGADAKVPTPHVPMSPSCRQAYAARPAPAPDEEEDTAGALAPGGAPSVPVKPEAIVAEAHGSPSLGTHVHCRSEAQSPDSKVEQQLGWAIARLNPQPTPRLAHFRWLGHVDGWNLQIEEIKPDGASWEATVRVTPFFTNRSVTILDHFVEIYSYSDGRVGYVRGYAPDGFPNKSMITD